MQNSTGLIERGTNTGFPAKQLSATDELLRQSARANTTDRRNIKRVSVCLRGVLYHGDRFQTTTIENLSNGGAGLNGAVGIAPGDDVTIRLLNGRELSGEVIWWLAGHCGVAFYDELDSNDTLFQRKRSRLG